VDLAGGKPLTTRYLDLIVLLAIAALALPAADLHAQGAFPAPLPGASSPAASPFPPVSSGPASSPFPPVNGAASASSPFPSAGVAPISGGFAPPQQAGPPGGDDCMKGFLPLRQEAEKRGSAIKAASARHAPPQEACKLIGNFAQSEVKMIKYIETNAQKCGIPANVGDQMKTGHKNTEKMMAQVCNVAQQVQTRGPAAPTLADVLGSSAAMPEATTGAKRGGSTFDTLNGNVLTR
jgi:hypothetical protein